MDQIKIGTFIAERRKIKNLTQEQLGEILGVTDKSISKWENGLCLPDSSLYKKLCDVLEITINDLFAGKIIDDKEYKTVADENLFNLLASSIYSNENVNISFKEFKTSLQSMNEFMLDMMRFANKDKAIEYLTNETGLSKIECESAYDFCIKLNSKIIR